MECRAKSRKSSPPDKATSLSLIREASNLPPITANPVHMAWPTEDPKATRNTK